MTDINDEGLEIPYTAPIQSSIAQNLAGLIGFVSMAREIIQNADDAGAKKIQFDITDEALIIWNDAAFRSCGMNSVECTWAEKNHDEHGKRNQCDFHAIGQVSSGNKYWDPEATGRFGVGFVSVYQITDNPVIISGDTEFTLDPATKKNRIIKNAAHTQGSKFILRWAFDKNSPVRQAIHASNIKKEDIPKLMRDIASAAEDSLYFLRSILAIEIMVNGERKNFFEKRIIDSNRYEIFSEHNGTAEKWHILNFSAKEDADLLREQFERLQKQNFRTELQIALPIESGRETKGKIFAFLPTDQDAPLPGHINADFFPKPDRSGIIISGETHERHWNEMLLKVAAREIGNRIEELRDAIGAKRLWALINEIYDWREDEFFSFFWEEVSTLIHDKKIYFTQDQSWMAKEDCVVLTGNYSEEEISSLSKINIATVDMALLPFRNAMLADGVQSLSLKLLTEALIDWDSDADDGSEHKYWNNCRKIITPMWSILDRLVGASDNVSMLDDVRFIPTTDGKLEKFSNLKCLPNSSLEENVTKFFPNLQIVHNEFRKYDNLFNAISELSLDCLLQELADSVTDEVSAKEFMPDNKKNLNEFYDFLAGYPRPAEDEYDYYEIVCDTPFLAGHDKFISPNSSMLPGGFTDPIGYLNTIDRQCFGENARKFLTDELNVKTLNFEKYICRLPEILEKGVSDKQYIDLIEELLKKTDALDNENIKASLESLQLIKTMDGRRAQPNECYFRTQPLVDLLGDNDALWIDKSPFPNERIHVYEGFFTSIGLSDSASINHALDRIEEIKKSPISDETRKFVSPIFIFVFHKYRNGELTSDSDELSRLHESEWLIAEKDGEIITEDWYRPRELYDPYSAAGFASQIPMLSVEKFAGFGIPKEFCNFLGMRSDDDVDTDSIVSHLELCIERNAEPDKSTYRLLNDRLHKNDAECINRLADERCIFASNINQFVSPKNVFWNKVGLSEYCYKAPSWMEQYRELFEFLGVAEFPSAATYSAILVEIANKNALDSAPLPANDSFVHQRCLECLSGELTSNSEEAKEHLKNLKGQPVWLTVIGTLAFASEVMLKDSDWLADTFNGIINSRLVAVSPETIDVFNQFDIPTLSSLVSIQLIECGDSSDDVEMTSCVRDRSDLLIWLCYGMRKETILYALDALKGIRIVKTNKLIARSVVNLDEIEYASDERADDAVYLNKENIAYVNTNAGGDYLISLFRAIFLTLFSSHDVSDIGSRALNARAVLRAKDHESAKFELEQAGFNAPTLEGEIIPDIQDGEIGDLLGDSQNGNEQSETLKDGDGEGAEMAPGSSDSDPADNPNQPEKNAAIGGDADGNLGNDVNYPAATTSEGIVDADMVLNDSVGGSADNIDEEGEFPVSDAPQKSTPKERTKWIETYVYATPEGRGLHGESISSKEQAARNASIDSAAIEVVVEHEESRGCEIERMPHNNPGFDLISRNPDTGEERYIEVKGTGDVWGGRGVSMSKTQILFAKDNPTRDFWLYVVECAHDDERQAVIKIQNPFSKIDHFMFDGEWRNLAEEDE